jgi:MoaA/NifB/PqqE/SkfB family radical SAM enzyme
MELDILKRLKALATVYGKGGPFLLMNRINRTCNLRCETCDWWKAEDYHPERELTTDQLAGIFRRAARAGITDYAVYGGESLLRTDLDRVLAEASAAGLATNICTNGVLLEDRARELAPNIVYCILSVDGVGEVHDRIRGVPGTFAKLVRGVEALRRVGPKVRFLFWSQINRSSRNGLKEIVDLARDTGAEVEFIPTWPIPGYNDDLVLSGPELAETAREVMAWKKAGDPIMNSNSTLELMRNPRPFVCNLPRICVTFDYDGSLRPCGAKMATPLDWAGSLKDWDVGQLVRDPRFKQMTREWATCNECMAACAMAMKDNLLLARLEYLKEKVQLQWARRGI